MDKPEEMAEVGKAMYFAVGVVTGVIISMVSAVIGNYL